MPGRRIAQSPVAALVAFSAATNLGIAGRTARVGDDVPEAPAVRDLLRGFGARLADPDEPADLAVAASDGAGPLTADAVLVRLPAAAATSALDRDTCPRAPVATCPGSGQQPPGADAGADARIAWARSRMPVAAAQAAALPDVAGLRVGVSLVLEPKTAVLALLLHDAGAAVSVFAFAAETDDRVAAALVSRGIAVHASSTAPPDEERAHALALLDGRPQVLVDDGAHVIRLAHQLRPEVLDGMLGAAEETTSGVAPLTWMARDGALHIPVVAVNEAVSKRWFDNRHGTGETVVLAIVRALDDDLSGARVAVLGAGPVGEGVAQRLAALGADVVVADPDARRALAARFAGHRVATWSQDAVRGADLVVSASGAAGTVAGPVLDACRDDAVIAVAGGAPDEVRVPRGTRRERIGPHLERLHLGGGRTVRLLGGGDAVNIAAAEGNPIDVMDLSFGAQLAAIGWLVRRAGGLEPGLHPLPDPLDEGVAARALGRTPPSGWTAGGQPRWQDTRFGAPR